MTNFLQHLNLRNQILLLTVSSMLLVAITLGIADRFSYSKNEQFLNQGVLDIQKALWQELINEQLSRMAFGNTSVQRDRNLVQSAQENDLEQLRQAADTSYKRLLGANLLDAMQVIDPRGTILYSSDSSLLNAITQLQPVKAALQHGVTQQGVARNANGDMVAVLVFPLMYEEKTVAYAVFQKRLAQTLRRYEASTNSHALLARNDGNIEYSSDNELRALLDKKFSATGGIRVESLVNKDMVYRSLVQPLHDSDDNTIAQLITITDITNAYKDNRLTQWFSYLAIVIGIVISSLFLVYYLRRLFKPMENLIGSARSIAAGNLAARSNVIQRNDEIGEMGRNFNLMADQIQEMLDKADSKNEVLEGKIGLIVQTVDQASRGDLTATIMHFSGDEAIDKLAAGVQQMIDSLNDLVAQVQMSGIQVTSAATEIAATARQQEASVTEQAASTNQIMATATQISATTQELANTMREVAEVADNTAASASDGQSALTKMEKTMHQMHEATASISSKLAVLSEKAANINTVVTTITKVADQTNLLSLNAAIEAEKAGEYGLGFAVVATEIRRLADQTAVATWDIEQMVKEMQSAVSAGVMGMDKFTEEVNRGVDEVRQIGSQLADIIEQVQTLTPRFEYVNDGMQSQSLGAQQISEGMVQLNESAQQTVESLRQSTLSIESLKDAAQDLQTGVSIFTVK